MEEVIESRMSEQENMENMSHIAVCYDEAPLHDPTQLQSLGAEVEEGSSTHAQTQDAAPPTLALDAPIVPAVHQFSFATDKEKFQAEISKWEETYDQIHHHLSNKGTSSEKLNMPKHASNFTISQDGSMFYSKHLKDGSVIYLKVVRDYADRVHICREIHLNTGDVTLHYRRDKMLELLGQMYFWKGQRRDVCQCIASCEVCSAGLGAKRKAKPPGQKRDIPRNGPPDPPKKKAKIGRPRLPKAKKATVAVESLMLENSESGALLSNDLSAVSTVLTNDLAVASAITQIVGVANQQQQAVRGSGNKPRRLRSKQQPYIGEEYHAQLVAATERDTGNPLDASDVSFHQIFTTIEEGSSDQNSPVLQESSLLNTSESQDTSGEEASIYELLFKLPSTPNNISPSVVEAVHMAMRETPDETLLFECAEAVMRQILSLGHTHNVIFSPTSASAYTIAVFASMLRVDPLSVSSQISSRLSSPLAVLHDACCAQVSNSELGPIKTCTVLTGSYNWNLGDMTYPMDKDMVRMAVQSNRVAAVFYQPYAYIEKSQHISLETLSAVCHSRGADVAVIVDASTMPTNRINLKKLVAELKRFFNQGADLVLLPSVEKLHGQSHASVLVGVSSLLSKVWRSIVLLQKQVCLPLLCLPHDLVGTVVTYKALQEQS